MKVVGLDGKEYKWNLGQFNRQRPKVSAGHARARQVLKELYPAHIVLEELTLPGCGRSPLYADFFINGPKLMVEVHGKQHFEFNSFHFKTKAEFVEAQSRDRRKAEWCELNGIRLVVLKDEDSDDEWRDQITNR